MIENIILTYQQSEIMKEFYELGCSKVIFNKRERKLLWDEVRQTENPEVFLSLKNICPALYHRIYRHYDSGDNVQSAVFSECVYAQTLANLFNLKIFYNCFEDESIVPCEIMKLLETYSLKPRYVYANKDKSRMLIQAGGCGGVDSALITVIDCKIFTIEFKEPSAKTSEPDLPKYGEDGKLRVDERFLSSYPQFSLMLNEQQNLNFFKEMGHNINNFTYESVNAAITNNYNAKKFADVVCTEDVKGSLVMLPINQVSLWAKIEGEIRPAGRNHYDVWTPNALRGFLQTKGATIDGSRVRLKLECINQSRERGGTDISRYKINSLFFVRPSDCQRDGVCVSFNLSAIRQLNPTIAGKMFFKTLKYIDVKNHYFGESIP